MDKKRSLILFSLFDLLFLGGLIIIFYEYNRILLDASHRVEMIKFGNRFSFLIVGATIPMVHFLGIVEYFRPSFIIKNVRIISIGLIFAAILLFFSGFVGVEWIKSRVENAGYVYCREASGVSAFARSVVYTKDMKICEAMVDSQRKARIGQ